jgi:hypothetical protein
MSAEQKRRDLIADGEASYRKWLDDQAADPEFQAVYEEEAAKKELWIQLVEARQAAGMTQMELAKRLGVSQAMSLRWATDFHSRFASDSQHQSSQGGKLSLADFSQAHSTSASTTALNPLAAGRPAWFRLWVLPAS